MITGQIQFTDPGKFGFAPALKVNGVRYGADSKGNLPAGVEVGATVSFEYFDKAGKDGRQWPTYKLQSLKLAAPAAAVANGGTAAAVAERNFSGGKSDYAKKEDYWASKAKTDEARDPRISYQGALERAIAFADLAFRAAALPLPKADNKKLDVLAAFVDETANRFLAQTYAATVPMLKPAVKLSVTPGGEVAAEAVDLAAETDEDWS
jgi:hypothetical protein